MDPSTADGGSGRAAVELTSLATVAAVDPSTADGDQSCGAVELTSLATVATAVGLSTATAAASVVQSS